jgi:hypothetical protein
MDNGELSIWTVYDTEGFRIGFGIQANAEEADSHGAETARLLSKGGTYKVWVAKEVTIDQASKKA